MVSETFCLRWNDFETNISSAFRELRDDQDFFDVTLACDDEQIQAHKVILSACSPFFRNVLRRNPHQHPLLYLKGVKFTDLLSVLNFMYHGEVNIAQEELNSFLAVAEDLRVKGLTQNQSESSSRTTETCASPKARPPGREPAAPPKRSRSTESFIQDNEDIQEVVPEKTELREHILPTPISVTQQVPPPRPSHVSTPVQQSQQLQQMDDSLQYAGEESYDDHGQYGAAEGGYEAGMVDTGIEAVLDCENNGTGRDIVMGIENELTIDIMGNSEVQTKVKEECLIEMGIKLETEDIVEKKKRKRRVPGGDSIRVSCRKRSHVSCSCSTVFGGEGLGMADSDKISVRKKAKRCGECSHCTRDNCGACPSCQDMVRFGGSGKKLKKGCLERICICTVMTGRTQL